MTEDAQLHNVAAINGEICNAFAGILADENYKAELKAEHIDPVSENIKERWGSLKAKTGLELDELKLMFKLYKRQEQGKAFDDEEDRNRVADNLRTAFSALAKGGMLDFVDVLETDHVPQQARDDAEAMAAEQTAAGIDEDAAA